MIAISVINEIVSLKISESLLTDADVAELGELKTLLKLNILDGKTKNFYKIEAINENMMNVFALNLTEVEISKMHVTTQNNRILNMISKTLGKLTLDQCHLEGFNLITLNENQLLELNLPNNDITENNFMFNHLPFLQKLNLHNNKIRSIQGMRFKEMPNLKLLNLSHNEIETIPKDAFNGKLKKLDLTHNLLRVIDDFTHVKYSIIIDGNQLDCDFLKSLQISGKEDILKFQITNSTQKVQDLPCENYQRTEKLVSIMYYAAAFLVGIALTLLGVVAFVKLSRTRSIEPKHQKSIGYNPQIGVYDA